MHVTPSTPIAIALPATAYPVSSAAPSGSSAKRPNTIIAATAWLPTEMAAAGWPINSPAAKHQGIRNAVCTQPSSLVADPTNTDSAIAAVMARTPAIEMRLGATTVGMPVRSAPAAIVAAATELPATNPMESATTIAAATRAAGSGAKALGTKRITSESGAFRAPWGCGRSRQFALGDTAA